MHYSDSKLDGGLVTFSSTGTSEDRWECWWTYAEVQLCKEET